MLAYWAYNPNQRGLVMLMWVYLTTALKLWNIVRATVLLSEEVPDSTALATNLVPSTTTEIGLEDLGLGLVMSVADSSPVTHAPSTFYIVE